MGSRLDTELEEEIGQLEIFGSFEKKRPHADSRDFGSPGAPSALKAHLSVSASIAYCGIRSQIRKHLLGHPGHYSRTWAVSHRPLRRARPPSNEKGRRPS